MRDLILERLFSKRGTITKVANGLGITVAAVSLWKRVPVDRVCAVERITDIPRHKLRPDIYPARRERR